MLTGLKSNSRKTSNLTTLMHFSPAESKIFIVFLYYMLSGALWFTTFSLSTNNIDHDIKAAHSYFDCQRNGYDSTCSLNTKQNPVWSLLAIVILMLFPAINLVYAVKFSEVKKVFKKIRTGVDFFVSRGSKTLESTVETSGTS